LINAGDGVVSSVGLFENVEQAEESTRVAAAWVRDETLEAVLPNAPEITSGEVIAHENGAAVLA
jgi:hypothetical protein